VQWATPHLVSLGAVEISRAEYLRLLDVAVLLDDAFEGKVATSRASLLGVSEGLTGGGPAGGPLDHAKREKGTHEV
jgi:hypothetical protein